MHFFKQWSVTVDRHHYQPREEKRLAYNDYIERMRLTEFPMLKGTTYLDHGGTTLSSRSLLRSFCQKMQSTLLGNPHSDTSNPSASAVIVEETRQKVLRLFQADPEHFDVVFTANATGAIKLVMEGLSGNPCGFDYYYHRNCHTSLVGVREVANKSHCLASNEETQQWLDEGRTDKQSDMVERPVLFAYPAQSNMNGQRLPLYWPAQIRTSTLHPNTYTLLDVAALVSTSPLDLSNHFAAPDFTVMSFYKIFGFPDLGALIVRKSSAHVLDHRKYFGGGTTEMITCVGDSWVARKQSSIHARWEDGTIAIRSILALNCAIDTHQSLFGGLNKVSDHTGWLAKSLHDRLSQLKHSNGAPVCEMYTALTSSHGDAKTQGATVAFNIRKSDGSWMSGWKVGAMLRQRNIHVRTGGLCNPAGMACALGISATDVQKAFHSGFRCNQQEDVQNGVLFGMIRVTFGAMSALKDTEILARFIEEHLVERTSSLVFGSTPDELPSNAARKEDISIPVDMLESGHLGTLDSVKRTPNDLARTRVDGKATPQCTRHKKIGSKERLKYLKFRLGFGKQDPNSAFRT